MLNEQTASRARTNRPLVVSAPERDETLAVRAAHGDADSFMRLYRLHVRAVYRYLLARLGHAQDAEDVTAQVFERAWTSLPRFRPTGTFKSWLFTIAQRTLVDHYRQHPAPTLPLDNVAEAMLDPLVGLEDSALASEQLRQVLHLIGRLTPEQQEVMRLRFFAELRYDEIARLTGKRESAVKMMAYRALEEIRRSYQDEKYQE